MPERAKAIDRMTRALYEGQNVWYNNADYTMHIGSRKLNSEEREAFWQKHEDIYDAMIKGIDWNRVLLEALGCHLARQLRNPEHRTEHDDYGDMICPDCVMRALLADRTFVGWERVAEHLENHTKPCKDCSEPIPDEDEKRFCDECAKFQ